MRAYIEQIDITSNGKVAVSGYVSRTNLSVNLKELHYLTPPQDGIWGYVLEVLPTSFYGGEMIVPFAVEAPWTGDENSIGVRISQPSLVPNMPDLDTVQLKARKVKDFTTDQANFVILKAGSFDKKTQQLVIDINYTGGCFPHLFALEWDGSSMESNPPQYNFNLVDLSDYDPCKAILPAQLRFDIDTTDIQLDYPSFINLGTIGVGSQLSIRIE